MLFLGSLVPWVMGSGSRSAAIQSLMPYSSAKLRAAMRSCEHSAGSL